MKKIVRNKTSTDALSRVPVMFCIFKNTVSVGIVSLVLSIASTSQATTLWSEVYAALAACNAEQNCGCYLKDTSSGNIESAELHKICVDGSVIKKETLSLEPESPTTYAYRCGCTCNPGSAWYQWLADGDCGYGNWGAAVTTLVTTYCDDHIITSTEKLTYTDTKQTCSETIIDKPDNCSPVDTLVAAYNHICHDGDTCCIDPCACMCCGETGGGGN